MSARRLSLYDRAMADGGMTQSSGTPAVISAGLYFAELPDMSELETLVREKLLSFDALAGRPVSGRWEPCAFEFEKHVLKHECADESDLLAFAQSTMQIPLQNAQAGPWWEMHLCNTTDPSSRAMLFFRVEHACADGMAILSVLSKLATTLEGEPLPPAVFTRPTPPPISWLSWLCSGLGALLKYANLPLGAFDSSCPFRPHARGTLLTFSPNRKLVAIPPHSLHAIKRTKERLGGGVTVNDVCYAGFAGAVRRYCEERDDGWARSFASTASLRALVPLAFPRQQGAPLTNDWTFLSTPLPVHESTASARLKAASSLFSRLKATPEALISRLLVSVNATLPPALFGFVGRNLMSRHSVVFSNVPGPAQPIALCGKPVLGLLPAFPNLIPQVLCVSYLDTMWMSLTVDADRIAEPERLGALYLDELRALAAHAGVDFEDASAPPPPEQSAAMKPHPASKAAAAVPMGTRPAAAAPRELV